jgi:uncharacterized tellurite resistance protein B-like protein
VVARHLEDADPDTVRIVAAIAGLLAHVAYADHDYSAAEEHHIRAELARVRGLTIGGVDAICLALREHIAEIAAVEAPHHARALRELTDRDLRVQVLELLVDVAAADDDICLAETNLLRQMATSLGLTQDDYNAAQARHRDKLRVLRR